MRSIQDVSQEMPIPFAFIIDESDCIFRERKEDSEAQKCYLDFLRNFLKDNEFVGLAKEYKADFTEMKRWYDGYHFPDTYEALRAY